MHLSHMSTCTAPSLSQCTQHQPVVSVVHIPDLCHTQSSAGGTQAALCARRRAHRGQPGHAQGQAGHREAQRDQWRVHAHECICRDTCSCSIRAVPVSAPETTPASAQTASAPETALTSGLGLGLGGGLDAGPFLSAVPFLSLATGLGLGLGGLSPPAGATPNAASASHSAV